MGQFDSKIFNGEVFGSYVDRTPNLNRNELLKSGALKNRSDFKNLFSEQTGSFYGTVPIKGILDGDALNYDGSTDITSTGTTTYSQSVIVVGRAKAWTENDFSEDITAGEDFMQNVASQVGEYWDNIDQETILSVLKGIFSMTGTANKKFVDTHTYDITAKSGNEALLGPTTLNNTMAQACGDNKATFSLAIMHSTPATNLENLKLLDYLKYTDKEGIERQLSIGTWNGRIVLVDDGMPVEDVAESSDNAGDGYTKYTTYVLGNGAIDYCDVGAKIPYEMDRDPAKNGGQDTLYSRQRKVFAPKGVSFTKKSLASLSPTNSELENGTNWELVKDATGSKTINHKAIAIARIISKG